MSKFISGLAPALNSLLDYREALGFSRDSYMSNLTNFDYYCAEYYSNENTVSKDMALGWLRREMEKTRSNINAKATAVRMIGKYLTATGRESYILPDGIVTQKTEPTPYIFTDSELVALFNATDSLWEHGSHDALIAPVLFRLIYTCGLRPNEGRELECANVNLDTGEILITRTKRKKERLVVMSCDMLTLCKKYNERRKDFGGGSAFFFPSHDGAVYSEQRLDRLFKKCWAMANPSVSPDELPSIRMYDLRHRFASAALNRWLDEKRDLYTMLPYLRAYMGHKHMSETAYYIHILPENLLKSASIDWAALESLVPEVSIWQG
jgi:integrase